MVRLKHLHDVDFLPGVSCQGTVIQQRETRAAMLRPLSSPSEPLQVGQFAITAKLDIDSSYTVSKGIPKHCREQDGEEGRC